jgi:hypothetical protein
LKKEYPGDLDELNYAEALLWNKNLMKPNLLPLLWKKTNFVAHLGFKYLSNLKEFEAL